MYEAGSPLGGDMADRFEREEPGPEPEPEPGEGNML